MELVSSIKDVKKLSNNSISIWGIQVSKYSKNIDNIYNILSINEQLKANNLKNKNHARASVLARGALRILLGAYENSAPEGLNFSKTKDGKPFLPNSRINFNISHSSDWIILAFCKDHSIGVDLEAIRDIDFLRISKRYFNQEEQIFLINSDDPKRLFFDLWSRKEAIIKAKGKRLLTEIKKTNISFVDNKIPLKCKIDDWFVYSVKAGSHYSAALAVNAEIDHHPCYDFRSLLWQD